MFCIFVDTWHRYDGIITPEPSSGFFKTIKHKVVNLVTGKDSKELEKLAIAYTKEFIPRLFREVLGEHEVLDVAESVEQVDMLLHGLEKCYVVDLRCWKSVNEFKSKVMTLFISFISKIRNHKAHIHGIHVYHHLDTVVVKLVKPDGSQF